MPAQYTLDRIKVATRGLIEAAQKVPRKTLHLTAAIQAAEAAIAPKRGRPWPKKED